LTRIKINEKEIDSLDSKLNKLYENDITLNYIKQYEEDRKKLLAPHSVDTISSELKNLKESLSNINIKNAFPSNEAYIKYSEPILNTIKTNDYSNLQKLISEPFRPNLRNDYEQVLKATEIFLDSSKKVMNLGLAEQSYYDKLNESIEKYQTNKLEGSQGLLGLASEMNSDLFKTKLDLGLAYGGLADSVSSGKTFEELIKNTPKFDLENNTLSKIAELGKTDLSLAYGGLATSVNLGKTLEGVGSIAKFDLGLARGDLETSARLGKTFEELTGNLPKFDLEKDSLSKIAGLGKLDLGLAYGDLATSARLGKTFEELAGNLPKFDLEKDSLSKIAGLGKLDLGLAYGDLATSARLGKTFEELAGNLPKFDLEKDSLSKIAGLGKTSILNTPITESYSSKISELAGLGSSLRENADNLSLQNKLFEETKINMFNIKPNLNMNEPNKYLRPLKIKNNLNKKLILKFEKQIEIIQEMSEYLVASGENQEIHANNLLEQNNNLIINSHKQIDLMANISSFLATQSEILNIQRENQEIQNEELKKQNNTMEEQVIENKSSSKIALWTAISSILLGTVISIGIYFAEDISDTENHEDMKKVIQHNNNEVQLEKLIQQLTIQNENLKSMNEQLIIQNKNLDFIKKDISKENK
jgi:hypothetical protein